MYEFTGKTVRDIALATPAAMPVLEGHKIDYCCGGYVAFDEACEQAGLAADDVWKEIEASLNTNKDTATDFTKWTQAALVDHIIDEHHDYTRDAIKRLTPLMEKVLEKHGPDNPELSEVKELFEKLAEDMIFHMKKEETMLFPFIKQLERMRSSAPMQPFGSVLNPVRVMMSEHDTAADIVKNIRGLSGEYAPPASACPSYIALYNGLKELDEDLRFHIHLENNILFPRAIEMEDPANDLTAETPKAGTCCTSH